jgi:hypothetical protein
MLLFIAIAVINQRVVVASGNLSYFCILHRMVKCCGGWEATPA